MSSLEVLYAIGNQLWQDLWVHKRELGGIQVLIVGPPGKGKTTFMLRGAELLCDFGEIVVWRGRKVEQIHRLPKWEEKTIFYVYYEDEAEFLKVSGRKAQKLDIEYKEYYDAKDLILMLKKGKINVVYEPLKYKLDERLIDIIGSEVGLKEDEINELRTTHFRSTNFWIEFFYFLINRLDTEWYAVFLDEADSVFPRDPTGVQWKLHEWAAEQLRDLRKTYVSLYMSAHDYAEIDYRIRRKIQGYVYMPHARVPDRSRVKDSATLKMKLGQAMIDLGIFGLKNFKPLPPIKWDFKVKIRPKTKVMAPTSGATEFASE